LNEITIPNEWQPRPHQLPFFQAMETKKRGCLVWHRRAGKDSSSLNFTAKEMFKRVGNYWHLFPKQTQARKAIWNGIDGQGRKILTQAFPESIRKRTQGTEMMLELVNGSTWQLCGSDNYDSLVGSNPVGVVFSEWALCDPNAWSYIRPMLAENGGWALFIYTSRGKNHGYSLYKMARDNPDWHCEILTVDDTKREDGSPVIGPDIIAEERAEGMREDIIQQEYYCSFDAQIPGAVYGDELRAAIDDKRVCSLPIDPALSINTAWDLGYNDQTSIWFWQAVGKEIRLVDYYECNRKAISHYVNKIKEWSLKHGCNWQLGRHLGPHDCERHDMNGKTAKMYAAECGLHMERTVRPARKRDGIQAARKLFPRLWIDDTRAELGYSCISSYHREMDDKKQSFIDEPVHDWSSHGADALQTLALGFNESMSEGFKQHETIQAKTSFNVFD